MAMNYRFPVSYSGMKISVNYFKPVVSQIQC